MKISAMTDGSHRVLILDTGGQFPDSRELALFFTRSITILGDVFLAGATPEGEYLAFDGDGRSIPLGPEHRRFLACPHRYTPMKLPPLGELLAFGEGEMEG